MPGPVRIFLLAAPSDQPMRRELMTHLLPISAGKMELWHEGMLRPGAQRRTEIDGHLERADLVLLLISADLLSYPEFVHAMNLIRARQAAGAVQVVPVLLRPSLWNFTELGGLEPLPANGKPVSHWSPRDQAWLEIVTGLMALIKASGPPVAAPPVFTEAPPPVGRARKAPATRKSTLQGEAGQAGPGPQNAKGKRSSAPQEKTGQAGPAQETGQPGPGPESAGPLARRRPMRVLVLAANPLETTRLDLGKEVEDIQESLDRARGRRLRLEPRWVSTWRALQRAVHEHRPDILHFSGHGTEGGGIVLSDGRPTPHVVPWEAVADLCRQVQAHLGCVFLNACHGTPMLDLLEPHVDYVVASTRALSDRMGREFAVAFYDALGRDESFQKAYDSGVVAVKGYDVRLKELFLLRGRAVTHL